MKPELAPLAKADLQDIWFYVFERDGLDRADGVLEDLQEAIELLGTQPGIGHAKEGLAADYNVWPVHEFLIVFLPTTTPLRVSRIWHGKRELEKLVLERPPNE